MNIKAFYRGIACYFFAFCLLSCVDDVDFDQADDFEATPVVNVALVFFDVEGNDFVNADTQEFIPVLRDTTRLEFLNDEFFREDVTRIDFVFEYENTFNSSFTSRAVFINNNNQEQFAFNLNGETSADGTPQITRLEQTVIGDDLMAIQSSISLVVELIPDDGIPPLDGTLSFRSRAVYFLEIGDL